MNGCACARGWPLGVLFVTLLAGAGLAAWFLIGQTDSHAQPEVVKVDYLVNSIGMKLAPIAAGAFRMGSPPAEKDRGDDELAHEVRIAHSFHMGAFEVTQAQYEKVMGDNPSFFKATGGGKARLRGRDTATFPVEDISWHQAQAFCKRLSEIPEEKAKKRTYRLPTEAEWEYACRAGTTTASAFGDTLDSFQANLNGLSPYLGRPGPFLRNPCPVGEYAANKLGLHDLHGNVQEWCSDWYDADYYKVSPKEDPPGPKEGTERVVRGGSWMNTGKACRSAQRNKLDPALTNYGLGFRVVME